MREYRKAFTLTELLVVVAILALLLSILAPSLASARRQTRTVLCGTNLRQIGIGWHLYAEQEHDMAVAGRPGSLPGNNLYWVGNGWKYRPRWLASLGAAVEIYAFHKADNPPRTDGAHQPIDNALLICPEAAEWTSERNASYGYNYQFLGNARLRTGTADVFVHFPVRASTILGAGTVVVADSLGTAAHFPAAQRTDNHPDGSNEPTAWGNHAYLLDPPRLTPGSDRCDAGLRSGPDPRHDGRAVFAFADGHALAKPIENLGYRLNPDGTFVSQDPQLHNMQFSGTGRDDDPPSIDD